MRVAIFSRLHWVMKSALSAASSPISGADNGVGDEREDIERKDIQHEVPYVHTFDFTPARRDLRGAGAFETFFQQLSRTRKKQAQRTPHRKKHYICDPERH